MINDEDEPGFTKPSKVYVTQEVAWVNLEAARKYGEVIYIVPRDVSPLETDRLRDAIVTAFKGKNFDPERDYVLITGNAVTAIEVINKLRTWGYNGFQYLAWDVLVNDYVIRRFLIL